MINNVAHCNYAFNKMPKKPALKSKKPLLLVLLISSIISILLILIPIATPCKTEHTETFTVGEKIRYIPTDGQARIRALGGKSRSCFLQYTIKLEDGTELHNVAEYKISKLIGE